MMQNKCIIFTLLKINQAPDGFRHQVIRHGWEASHETSNDLDCADRDRGVDRWNRRIGSRHPGFALRPLTNRANGITCSSSHKPETDPRDHGRPVVLVATGLNGSARYHKAQPGGNATPQTV